MSTVKLNNYQLNSIRTLYQDVKEGLSFLEFKKFLVYILEKPLPYHNGKQLIEILCPDNKCLLENGDEVSPEDYVRIITSKYNKQSTKQTVKGEEEYSIFNAYDLMVKELPEFKDKKLSEIDLEILEALNNIS